MSDIFLLLTTLIQAIGALACVFGIVGLFVELTSRVSNPMMTRNAFVITVVGWLIYVLGGALAHV